MHIRSIGPELPKKHINISNNIYTHTFLRSSSDNFIKRLWAVLKWIFVRASNHVIPHEQMTIVVLEKGVVDMMVGRRAKTEYVKYAVPRKSVFRMDESQPVGVRGSKCHVRPHVAVHKVGGCVKRDYDHAERVGQRAIECVEQARVGEFVVHLVGFLVKRR